MSVFIDNARILLADESYPGELLAATHALRDEFSRITGVRDQDSGGSDGDHTVIASGTAISPVDAARCLVDFARTTKFLRAVRAAIGEARRNFPGERVDVLYAGCGPWAPLALPLCVVLDPAEVGFRLLDIHERSLSAARQLVEHFELGDFITGFICDDATQIQLDRAPHVIVAETMQSALKKEPQLAITANLAGQLAPGGVFVPESIEVLATAADIEAEFAVEPGAEVVDGSLRRRVELGSLLDLNADSAGALLASARGDRLPPVVCEVPDLPAGRMYHLMLRTRVGLFGELALGDYETGLTYPVVQNELGAVSAGDSYEFTYRLGQAPGFEVVEHSAPQVREVGARDHLTILALNLESEHFLSPMNGEQLSGLLACAGNHRVLEVDGQVVAFLIALESGADYDSPNYQWFNRDRSDFVYVDRVVVSSQQRGRGYASKLYDELFGFARERGLHQVVCEYNLEPPNPASRAFHASYGFSEVGTREAGGNLLSMQCATLRAR